MINSLEIVQYIEELYSVDITDNSSDLMTLGVIDSMMAIELLSELENKFSVKIPFTEYTRDGFFSVDSIAESVNRIKSTDS